MKILITLSCAILGLGVPNAEAQTLSKEQAKEIADLVLKLDYKIKNQITKVSYNSKTDVWRCSQQRGLVHGDLDVEIRDRDQNYRLSGSGTNPPFRMRPTLQEAIRKIVTKTKRARKMPASDLLFRLEFYAFFGFDETADKSERV